MEEESNDARADDQSFDEQDKWSFTPRDEGTETSSGRGMGESFVQASGFHNLLGPGKIPPDYFGSSKLNDGHIYQDPQRNIPEYLARPRPVKPRDQATRSPSWVPIVQRTGVRNKVAEESDEGKGLVLSLALPNAIEEPSLMLTLGRDSFGKGKQAVETGRRENNVNSAMTHSTIELGEYDKYLSLRHPGTKDNSRKHAFRLPANLTGQVYHSGGASVLTNYADVNPDSGFKYMPFSFNCDEHGHLVPTFPFDQSFGRANGIGTDNFVQASNSFANHGRGLKSLGDSTNDEQGIQIPLAFTNHPIDQAYARGSIGLLPSAYQAMTQVHGLRFMAAPVGAVQDIPAVTAPVYDKRKGVTALTNDCLTYKIVEHDTAASSSTGKKDLITKGKLIVIPDDTIELCDETDTVLVTRTGNQEQVNPVSTQPINKGKGLLVRMNALQSYPMGTIPTGIEDDSQSESSSRKLPEEGFNKGGKTRKRKHEGATTGEKKPRRPKGRAPHAAFPTDVRSLLSTGVLDGIPVKYATWMRDKILRGIIAFNKILCGCQDCNYARPINPLEFERHAGGNTKHPNNHIHFPNGKTIYEIVQGLQKVPTENLFQAMESMAGSPLNQEKFEAWKAAFRASGIEDRRAFGVAQG